MTDRLRIMFGEHDQHLRLLFATKGPGHIRHKCLVHESAVALRRSTLGLPCDSFLAFGGYIPFWQGSCRFLGAP